MTLRLAVLVSGNGSNLQAILDAVANGSLDAEVAVVVSNRPEAFALQRAAEAGVPTELLAGPFADRSTADAALRNLVVPYQPDLVVLAGWMRILTGEFLDAFDVLNLHPALPGEFPGVNAIERAFQAWTQGTISRSGVMVHWVPDEGVDDGPVIAQEVVNFVPNDTLDTFESRMHAAEHGLLVSAIQAASRPRV